MKKFSTFLKFSAVVGAGLLWSLVPVFVGREEPLGWWSIGAMIIFVGVAFEFSLKRFYHQQLSRCLSYLPGYGIDQIEKYEAWCDRFVYAMVNTSTVGTSVVGILLSIPSVMGVGVSPMELLKVSSIVLYAVYGFAVGVAHLFASWGSDPETKLSGRSILTRIAIVLFCLPITKGLPIYVIGAVVAVYVAVAGAIILQWLFRLFLSVIEKSNWCEKVAVLALLLVLCSPLLETSIALTLGCALGIFGAPYLWHKVRKWWGCP